jgi:phospholipase C
VFNASIRRALAIPAHHRTGTIADVEHIVFLMQENRSFDHYFGTLRGVRGFGDPRAVRLPSGDPVWRQPGGGAAVLPFHPTAPGLGGQFLEDLPHDWRTTHDAWNLGKYDH